MKKKISMIIMSLALLSSFSWSVFAQEEISIQMNMGMDFSDETDFKNAEAFTDALIEGERGLFDSSAEKQATMEDFWIDEETSKQIMEMIEKRVKQENKSRDDDTPTQPTKFFSVDMENIKKLYVTSYDVLKNIDYDTDMDSLIASEDRYYLDIPCVTNYGEHSILSLHAGGDRASVLYHERIVLTNDEVVECVVPYLEENEEITDIKYIFNNGSCSFEIAIIKTSNDREFIVPDEDCVYSRENYETEMTPKLTKGTVYTKNEFVDVIQDFDFPELMSLEELLG